MAEASLIVGDMDISKLSDVELFQHLTSHGAVVGPIVCTTRKTYERKLAVLMGAKVANYSFTEEPKSGNQEDDQDVEPTQAYINRVSSGDNVARRRKPQLESRPVLQHDEDDDEEEDEVAYGEESILDASSPLYTPSPRRPLHSPDNSYSYSSRHQESYLSSPLPSSMHASPASPTPANASARLLSKQEEANQPQSSGGGMGQLIFKLLFVAIILFVTYMFFVARSEKDAFASLEHLAQTAAGAIEKGNNAPADKMPPPPRTGV